MFESIKKRVFICTKVLLHKLDRKLHPTFDDKKADAVLTPQQEKILKIWESFINDKESIIMHYKDSMIVESPKTLLILDDSGSNTGGVITIIKSEEYKEKTCIEVDLPNNISKLFQACFDDENLRRVKSVHNKKITILSNSLDKTLSEWTNNQDNFRVDAE